MLSLRTSATVLAVVLLSMSVSPHALAQIQAHARLDGEFLPIVTYAREHIFVLKDGKKRQTLDRNYEVRAGSKFAEGFVEIRNVNADIDPLRDATAKDRLKPTAIRFRYTADLVADRTLPECYALLTFITQGSIGTHIVPLGRLAAGKPKPVEFELRNAVDAVGSLHVFSKGVEVRSTDHSEPYDLKSYNAALMKNVRGLSAAELLKFEEAFEHELSADGRFLATIRERQAKKVLIVYDLESMKLLCQTAVAETDDRVANLTWVSAHEVAYIAEEDVEEHGYSRSRYKLHLIDANTGKSTALLDDVYAIISEVPEKPEILVLYRLRPGFGSWTVKINVRERKTFEMEELGYGYSYFDRHGNDRVRVRYEEDERRYYFKPKPDSRWIEADSLVKQPGLKFNLNSADLLDRVADVHSIGPDGDLLYISTRLNSDRFELAAFSMSEGVIKRIIAKHPKYDLTTSDGGLSRLLFAKSSPRLLGMIYEGQKPQVVWLDPDFAAVQKRMDSTFPNHVNIPVDWSKDGSTFVYFSASDQDPGTYYVFRPANSQLIPLLERGERLKDKAMAKTTSHEFTARDGGKIPAYITRPPEPGEGRAPLIVYVHGGPMARDTWVFSASNQFFASRGYIVLQVNYRGSSGYGAAFQNAGLRARLDTVVLDDIADCARHLIAQNEVDPERVAIMGASFGGWATYMSLIKYPELYRAGVAIAAVSHWRKMLRDDKGVLRNVGGYAFWKSLLHRENFSEDEKFIDPYLRAAELKQPIYIMHGELDMVVHASESGLMLNALKKHNPHVQARSFPNATHTYWSFADRVVTLNEAALFFEKHLAAKPKVAASAAE